MFTDIRLGAFGKFAVQGRELAQSIRIEDGGLVFAGHCFFLANGGQPCYTPVSVAIDPGNGVRAD